MNSLAFAVSLLALHPYLPSQHLQRTSTRSQSTSPTTRLPHVYFCNRFGRCLGMHVDSMQLPTRNQRFLTFPASLETLGADLPRPSSTPTFPYCKLASDFGSIKYPCKCCGVYYATMSCFLPDRYHPTPDYSTAAY